MSRRYRSDDYLYARPLSREDAEMVETDVNERVRGMRDKLTDDGFKIHDVRVTRRVEPPYRDFNLNRDYDLGNAAYKRNFADPIQYGAEFTMSVTLGQAEDFMNLADRYDSVHRECTEIKERLNLAFQQIGDLEGRRDRLRRTLDENPGIKDQWEEMLTMLKLAGFDDDLT